MKQRGLQNSKRFFLSLFLIVAQTISLSSNNASAATYSLVTTSGSAQYGSVPWGQTFTIPAGKSGTVSSISNILLLSYCNTVADVTRVSIYDSPSKSTLLATALTDFTSPMSSGCNFATTTNFTANFTPFAVTENTQYYFELSRISGNSPNFYFYENCSNPYAGGTAYHGGYQNTSCDLGMSINIDFSAGPVSVTLGLTSGTNQATYRTISQLKAITNTASTVSFYVNKKIISGCRNVATSANIAYCNWKPSIHGMIAVMAIAKPIDTSNYSTNSATIQTIGVKTRSNSR